MAVLEHLKTLVGKGGEGGESSAQASGKEQAPWMGCGTVSAKQGEKYSDEEASQQVDYQCAPRET